SDIDFDVYIFFFFQAEDGIRDFHVTGVQTCALPISKLRLIFMKKAMAPQKAQDFYTRVLSTLVDNQLDFMVGGAYALEQYTGVRSEERRVGKECILWWSQHQ